MKKRQLIPEDQVIVILDTSPVRNLAHSDFPKWVETFTEMAKNGYSFSLADTTVAELLMQVRSKRIPRDGYNKMIEILKSFLNPDLPILPGQVDLEIMIGIQGKPYHIQETLYLSQEAWRQLVDPDADTYNKGLPLEQLREEEIDIWQQWLEHLVMTNTSMGLNIANSDPDIVAECLADITGDKIFPEAEIEPSMDIRMHLELRYRFRQMARYAQTKKPYNPKNKRNINDAMDLDLYRYFILPAFVVAEDSGFFNSIENIKSYQVDWFKRPEQLAKLWLEGKQPKPTWPKTT